MDNRSQAAGNEYVTGALDREQLSFDPVGKVFLAPMVRVSTHPFRLLALKYGADYVFSEEIIDQRVLNSTRVVNDELNTVDFVQPDGVIVFRTSAEERGRVIVQLGTACPERALKASQMLENDVVAIDLNMGCPKEYSIKGGMGAALLSDPERAKRILTRLTGALRVPVSCKIRILPKLEDTLKFVKMIESTGVSALTVHGRTPSERPRDRNHDEVIRAIADSVSVPVIANGGSKDTIRLHEDIEFFRLQTGASSVMIARAAMWNPSIFQNPTSLNSSPLLHDLIREYLSLAIRYDHHLKGTKYCIQHMLHLEGSGPWFLGTVTAVNMKQLCSVWGLEDLYLIELNRRSNRLRTAPKRPNTELLEPPSDIKRFCCDYAEDRIDEATQRRTITKYIPFERKCWAEHGVTPKQILIRHCQQQRSSPPQFQTKEDPATKLFHSTVILDGLQFVNSSGCRSRKFAEQAAALVCLDHFGIPNGKSL